MSNPSKQKGTAWESCIVEYLRSSGAYPYAERRTLHGNKDQGDVTGIGPIVIEAKAGRTPNWSQWLAELDDEIDNAGAVTGAIWWKRVGKGKAEDGLVVMRPADLIRLWKEAQL